MELDKMSLSLSLSLTLSLSLSLSPLSLSPSLPRSHEMLIIMGQQYYFYVCVKI